MAGPLREAFLKAKAATDEATREMMLADGRGDDTGYERWRKEYQARTKVRYDAFNKWCESDEAS